MCFNEISRIVFCGTHAKPHTVIGLSKRYHLRLDHKLGNGKFSKRRIPSICVACANMLEKIWVVGSDPTRKPRCRPVED